MADEKQKISVALAVLLRPIVRVAIRHGFSFGSFSELLKRLYVEVGGREFAEPGRRQTVARIAVITGINRKEVTRLSQLPAVAEEPIDEKLNRSVRVISGWLNDKRFLDKKGDPEALLLDRGENSFSELVRLYSGDMSPRVLLEELLRVNAIEYLSDDLVRLTSRGYVPRGGSAEQLVMFGTDIRDLAETIEHNMLSGSDVTRFHRKVSYINFPSRHLNAFREMNARISQHHLEHLDQWLSEHDDPQPGEPLVRTGVVVFQFEHTMDEEPSG